MKFFGKRTSIANLSYLMKIDNLKGVMTNLTEGYHYAKRATISNNANFNPLQQLVT